MKRNYILYWGLAAVAAFFAVITYLNYKTVTLKVDEAIHVIHTNASTVGSLLKQQHVLLNPADRVIPAASTPLKNGLLVEVQRAVTVYIRVDGKIQTFSSQEIDPTALLNQANIQLNPGDQVWLAGEKVELKEHLPPASFYPLQIKRAVHINLETGSESQVITTTAATLGQALAEAGITLQVTDVLAPGAETPLNINAQDTVNARLRRSRAVQIIQSGSKFRIYSAANTVGEALSEAGLTLQGLDYSIPSPEDPLPEDGQIRLVRVREEVAVEQEPLSFETELQPAPDVDLDSRKVVQNGEYGIQARRVRIRIEDGQEVSRSVEAEWIAKQPQNRILGYGTKITIQTLDTPGGPVQYWRTVRMYATSYSPCRIFPDHCDSSTALGATLKKGVVAMTNYWCRTTCGDQVYVPGYGVGTVLDTGGGIPGRYWLDLGYSDDDYVSWHQWVTVYFLAPVPDNIMWILP